MHKLYDELKEETEKKSNSLELEVALLRKELKELKSEPDSAGPV